MGPPPHVTPNRAYVGPMLGLCLAKMGPMFGDWTISKNVEKHRNLQQKCPPAKAIEPINACLCRMPQKKHLGTFGAGGFLLFLPGAMLVS